MIQYRREIDGLRALAVLPVILFHAGFETFSGGFVGVDVFFVISGYLITTIIMTEIERGEFSLANFYERRARRILPALFLVMLVCIPFAWFWLLPSDMKDFSQSLIAVTFFASNILFWRESGYFDAATELKPLLHTWSLAVEEQFYIFFPLLLIFLSKGSRRWILITLGLAFVGSLSLAQWAAYVKPVASFYLLPTRGWELLIGAFAAFYLSSATKKEFEKDVGEFGGWLGVALIFYAIFTYNENTPFPGLHALVPTVGALLVILFATHQTSVGKFLGNKIFVGIGLISYSAYLWHQPLFAFARHGGLAESAQSTFLLLSVLALVLAYLSWRYVESAFRLADRLSRNILFGLIFVFGLGFVSIGLLGVVNDGWLSRYNENVAAFFRLKTMSDEYVWKNKVDARRVDFDDKKIKILVVGDSNSGDLINILSYADRHGIYSISSLTVNSGCGNLYLPRASFSHLIPKSRDAVCLDVDDLMSAGSRRFFSEADIVFFASSWSEWESRLISESHVSLIAEFGDKFYYFGNKHLVINPMDFFKANGHVEFPLYAEADAPHLAINVKMKESLGARFINPYDFFCDEVSGCMLSNGRGDLLLYDGFHLSREGANFFAEKMAELFRTLR